MANFLIQTINGQVKNDFSFALIEAIDYQNWLHNGSHEYYLSDIDDIFEHDFSSCVPSGTIQFMKKYLAAYYDVHTIRPINIPVELMKYEYLKRNCYIRNKSDFFLTGKKFIKSNENLKGYINIADNTKEIPDGEYLVSDLVDIDSEWRAFVYSGKLVGLQNYLGDFTMFPDVGLIESMIKTYDYSLPAYTLDVGINKKDGTFLIEVHNFYSCGLYGFNDCKVLPQMFIQSFRHLLKHGR